MPRWTQYPPGHILTATGCGGDGNTDSPPLSPLLLAAIRIAVERFASRLVGETRKTGERGEQRRAGRGGHERKGIAERRRVLLELPVVAVVAVVVPIVVVIGIPSVAVGIVSSGLFRLGGRLELRVGERDVNPIVVDAASGGTEFLPSHTHRNTVEAVRADGVAYDGKPVPTERFDNGDSELLVIRDDLRTPLRFDDRPSHEPS